MVAAAIGGSAALSAGSSLIGSGKSSSASKSAANESYYSTMASIDAEEEMYGISSAGLQAYRGAGYTALDPMESLASQAATSPWGTGYLNAATGQLQAAGNYQNEAQNYLTQAAGMTPPSQMTEAYLQNTPGYQFQLGQGLKATQAAAAARGLGVSGASLKGAATYATGLADSNYQNQFNNAQTAWQDVMNQGQSALNLGTFSQNAATGYLNQGTLAQSMQQQAYNQYSNLANLGESAAAGTAQAGTATSGQIANSYQSGAQTYGNYLTQAGQAQAAGTTGASNAVSSGVNNYLSYSLLDSMLGSQTSLQDQLNSSLGSTTLPYTQGNTFGSTQGV